MNTYDAQWAANYERLADASIAGRQGLYRLCKAHLSGLPAQARVLVVGCGTGEELVGLAACLPHASFVAVDPSEAMLSLCRERVDGQGLSARVALHNSALQGFDATPSSFDAATAVLVSQHVHPDAEAEDFFRRIALLLKPGGLLYSADLHIGAGQRREVVLALWRKNLAAAGIEPEVADAMLEKMTTEFNPRDEDTITGFLRRAGFIDVLMPFRSLMYGAWAARKGT